jgi:hypothetical protein
MSNKSIMKISFICSFSLEIFCIRYETITMKPVEIVLWKEGGRIKEKVGGGQSNYDVL